MKATSVWNHKTSIRLLNKQIKYHIEIICLSVSTCRSFRIFDKSLKLFIKSKIFLLDVSMNIELLSTFQQNYPEEFDGTLDCASMAVCCAYNKIGIEFFSKKISILFLFFF